MRIGSILRVLVVTSIVLSLSGPGRETAQAGVVAVCPNVAIGQYGNGCAVQFDVPVLKAGFDPTHCQLTLSLSGFPGCCNTFLANRIFLFGLNPLAVPAPPFGAGCMLLASPDLILVLPSSAGANVVFPIPPGLFATIYTQGINDYFTTFGLTHDYNWSNGVKIVLS